MKRIVGVYQSGAGEFKDDEGKLVKYDSIILWYESDEVPENMKGKFAGVLPHKERFKRSDVQTFGVPFDDWYDLVGAEVEFLYMRDKEDQLKINGVLVQSMSCDNKSNPKKEV